MVLLNINILNMYGHGANWDRQPTDLCGYVSHIKEKIYSKYIMTTGIIQYKTQPQTRL